MMKNFELFDDKTKQILLLAMYLLVTFANLFIAMFFLSNVIVTIICLTLCWFTVASLGKIILRIYKHKAICSFNKEGINIYNLPGKPRHMKWKDIRKASIRYNEYSIQLFLKGDHIDHMSGMYCIQISYPFQKQLLEPSAKQIEECFLQYRIQLETLTQEKKDVKQHV